MSEHPVQWMAPSPLWPEATSLGPETAVGAMRRPAILRFASDTFMEDLVTLMEQDPGGLAELRAQAETWRGPMAEAAPPRRLPAFERLLSRRQLALSRARPTNGALLPALVPPARAAAARPALKLYQPAHQRYYLIAACLVCGLPGLPDRALDLGAGERVSFVVRRLRPRAGSVPPGGRCDPDTCDEYAAVRPHLRRGRRTQAAALRWTGASGQAGDLPRRSGAGTARRHARGWPG
jgi:hypothetical protein